MREQFNNIISKKRSRVLTITDLKKIGQTIMNDNYADSKLYKLIYHAKIKGHLIAIKKDLFIPTSPDNLPDDQQITDRYYRPLLKKHTNTITDGRRYIGGLKALELITSNYNTPDDIDIITSHTQGSIVLFLDKKIHIKTYTHQGKSLFPLLYRHTESIKIGTTTLRRANLELALLESLYNPNIVTLGYTYELIKRTLKKHKKTINTDTIIALVRSSKHHSSLNRLHHLALSVDRKLADTIETIIKKYSFFVEV